MGDVGGFLGFLQMIGSCLIGWYSSSNAVNFMVSDLYKFSTENRKKNRLQSESNQSTLVERMLNDFNERYSLPKF